MRVDQFDYDLPEELIAQEPAPSRTGSRLMVVHRQTGAVEHRSFPDLLTYLREGDCLVLNDTRVIPGRLVGRRTDTGGRVEVTLLADLGGNRWQALVRPGRRARTGSRLVFGGGELEGTVTETAPDGVRVIDFDPGIAVTAILDRLGNVPLPPYIKKPLAEPERYQTVYARHEGSAAAPTAGLHFTPELLAETRRRGVEVLFVTLHVGLGTFRPVRVEEVEDHRLHTEPYTVGREVAEAINRSRRGGGRVVAVGTTTVRTLETVAEGGEVRARSGQTSLFIYPGYRFQVVDVLLTNFHLPRSTLLMLVCAFAGKETVLAAYREAVRERYRFFSFGDAMLIL